MWNFSPSFTNNPRMPLWAAYLGQMLLALALGAAGLWVSRRSPKVWGPLLAAAFLAMLLWPLMRFRPTLAIDLLGAPAAACIEITGLLVPAALVFSILSRRVPKPRDQRAVAALLVVAGLYFALSGRWMVHHTLPALGPTQFQGRVCKQSTDYTCVAASLVTMLTARGIQTSEQEMAELAFVQVGAGATDSRALWALERKLAGSTLAASYRSLTLAELSASPKPALVQLGWGFFVSHMVPVMDVTDRGVVIGDPLTGARLVPIAEFTRQWKGQAITLMNTSPEPVHALTGPSGGSSALRQRALNTGTARH